MRNSLLASTLALALTSAATIGAAWAAPNPAVTRVDNAFMMTPEMAYDWNYYKSLGGSTYAGSAGWKHYTDYLVALAQEFGLSDIDTVDIPYDHYVVDDELIPRRTPTPRARR